MSSESTKIKNIKEDHDEYLSLLKLSPPSKSTIIDHYSCCEFCNCDCTAESTRRGDTKCDKDRNNNNHFISNLNDNNNNEISITRKLNSGRKKKNKKSKRPKSVNTSRSYTKDCVILNEILNLELPKQSNIKQKSKKKSELPLRVAQFPPDNEFDDLCEPMQNLCLSPRIRQAYKKIPTHDRKILNRMAKRRNERAILNENAWLAQRLWENERFERELIKYEQDEEYRKAIREKQIYDNEMTKARVEAILRRDKEDIQRLRAELYEKDCKLQKRLKRIKLDKSIKIQQRNIDAFRKNEAVQIAQDEIHFDNAIKKQEICDRYENRLERAECIRNHILNSYLRRIKHANYIQQVIHEENFKEIDKYENIRRQQLCNEIQRKTNRTEQFVRKKQKNYNELLERAKISANLRDLVRNSVSPDGTQQYLNSMPNSIFKASFNERPISDLSFQSSVRLG
ncbi:meiosis-specific nuclear structural protein 1 [Condylostylus longicornis]|uniref:meiosis-specific nuclear structural protein 1 n=1 Tax=Condylostylus longicornis TaxID=2530218 RepID=UPI00244E38DF|nr:meiosis-specific nuclear structural protein 1 [Condylostylus longicornis]